MKFKQRTKCSKKECHNYAKNLHRTPDNDFLCRQCYEKEIKIIRCRKKDE